MSQPLTPPRDNWSALYERLEELVSDTSIYADEAEEYGDPASVEEFKLVADELYAVLRRVMAKTSSCSGCSGCGGH